MAPTERSTPSPGDPARRSRLIGDLSAHRLLGTALAAMSAVALALCALGATGVATDPRGDEGTLAHVYQLLIVMEVPVGCLLIGVAVRRGLRNCLTTLGAPLVLFIAALAAVPILGL